MKINKTSFVTGIIKGNEKWNPELPQIAFYGRSNAGKSSSINAILSNKSVAKTSSKPGKTTEINLFTVNDDFQVLDLPGYGYARGSLEQKNKLQDLIIWFIKETKVNNRTHVMVLDCKVGLTDIDKVFLNFLEKTEEKIIILFNKIDKINQKEFSKNFKKIQGEINDSVTLIPFSAKNKKGVDSFWLNIEENI